MLLALVMHITLSNIINTYVFLYAKTAIKVASMEYTDRLGFGRL